ncbi:MAG: hypothetical protein CVU77_05980 [Elusimicrobia bacterium HGW-Elusimicrobia-1]|jgi:4-amino-4-deoxy-L-arabinose transferase-like glycosyltransferase|nr:MAG: hypothetical protein CVU79_08410 [Elusimicrobia bacterium HGW-Elusimicrobia-3]PKN01228.1 MAG: hypothetical protein CVU77_05980 [Elusimicrobia bacterium HGW-Elusimicrobia-1]
MKSSSRAPASVGKTSRLSGRCLYGVAVAAVFAAALGARVWNLDGIPPGFYLDEGVYGLCASDIVDGSDRPAYFNRLWGVDAMYAYLAAVSFKIFGASVFSLRLVAGLAGALTVAGIFLLTFEIFRRPRPPSEVRPPESVDDFARFAAFVAAFVAAFCRWHINFSRIAFQGILLPAVSVFAFYFLFRAFRTRAQRDFALSGLFLGLGFYTYLPARLVPVAAVLAFLIRWRRQAVAGGKTGAEYISRGAATAFAAMAMASAPLWIHFIHHPEFFAARAREVLDTGSAAANLVKVALMFGVEGDANPRHNIPGYPMFSLPLFALFAGGFFLAVKNMIIGPPCGKNFGPSFEHGNPGGFLIGWAAIMGIPSIFSSEAPHALRTIGLQPPVFILCGYFAAAVYRGWPRKKSAKYLVAAFLVFLAFGELRNYFSVWADSAVTRQAFGSWQIEALKNAGGFTASGDVAAPMSFYTNPAVTFLAETVWKSRFGCYVSSADFEFLSPPRKDMIYMMSRMSAADAAVEKAFLKIYPRAFALGEISSGGAPIFVYYRVAAKDVRLSATSPISGQIAAEMNGALAAVRAACEAAPWLAGQLGRCDSVSPSRRAGNYRR